jgi:hypothetical protein
MSAVTLSRRHVAFGIAGVLLAACSDSASSGSAAGASGWSSTKRSSGSTTEGAPDLPKLLARVQAAIDLGDDREVLLSIRPTTRDGWLGDLVVALMAMVEAPSPAATPAVRARTDEIRRTMMAYGATLPERPKNLTPETLAPAMLERVSDKLGLHADLLAIARRGDAPFDPVRALEGGSSPSGMGVSLVRLVERVRAPAKLEEPNPEVGPPPPLPEGRSAAFIASAKGPVPVNVYKKDDVVWLDES